MYDDYLRGKDGTQFWEYDSHGRRLAEVRAARQEPVAGNNVYLTIDFDLQRRAEEVPVAEYLALAQALGPVIDLVDHHLQPARPVDHSCQPSGEHVQQLPDRGEQEDGGQRQLNGLGDGGDGGQGGHRRKWWRVGPGGASGKWGTMILPGTGRWTTRRVVEGVCGGANILPKPPFRQACGLPPPRTGEDHTGAASAPAP